MNGEYQGMSQGTREWQGGPGWAQGMGEDGWSPQSAVGGSTWQPYGGDGFGGSYGSGSYGGSFAGGILSRLGWNEAQSDVQRESLRRIALVGLRGVGKRSLVTALSGWVVTGSLKVDDSERGLSPLDVPDETEMRGGFFWGTGDEGAAVVSDFGLFKVVDLPEIDGHLDLTALHEADLVVLVTDKLPLPPLVARFAMRLRASGQPWLVLLLGNDGEEGRLLARRLGGMVVVCDDLTKEEQLGRLLREMIAANSSLLVPLGRSLPHWRRQLVRQVISETALMCSLCALEPIPLMDLPVQIVAQARLALRILAMYGHSSPSPVRRETLLLVAGCLALRLTMEQALKMLPVAGWLLAGVASAIGTWLLGWLLVLSLEQQYVRECLHSWWIKVRGGLRFPKLRRKGRKEEA